MESDVFFKCSKINSNSCIPSRPSGSPDRISLSVANCFELLPAIESSLSSNSIASSVNSFATNSLNTPSFPILSILSRATVKSDKRSLAPSFETIPANIFR